MSVRYSIDSAAYRNGLLYGWGWYLHETAPAKSIFFVLENTSGDITRLQCGIDRTRPDVAHAFPKVPHANYSGIIFQGKIPENFDGTAKFEVELHNGETLELPVPGFPQKYTGEGFEPRLVGGQISRGWRHFRAGRWSHIKSRLNKFGIDASRKFLQTTGKLELLKGHPLVLIIDHQLGGGANKFSADKLAVLQKQGQATALLIFNLPTLQFELTHDRNGVTNREVFSELDSALAILAESNITEISINDLVSYPEPESILSWVRSIKGKNKKTKLSFYLHDFFAVCPTWTLINAEGVFCQLPSPEICRKCLTSMPVYFPNFIQANDIAKWRLPWLEFIDACDQIVAFSQSTLDLYGRAFPDSNGLKNALVQPHALHEPPLAKVEARVEGTLVIVIIGNISVQKGARIVKEMARIITRKKLDARIVVLGTLDEMEPAACLKVTGPYQSYKLPELMRQHRVSVCLLPSICPETFSYATSEIMEMQLPLAVFNLGAPAERVRNYSHGVIIDTPTAEAALDAIFKLREHRQKPALNTKAPTKTKYAKTVVYTSAALNYLPKVRKLFASVRKYHPEFELVLALADRLPEGMDFSKEPLDRVISVEQLDIPDRTRWIFFHSLVELATAIKPFVMISLLKEQENRRVIYLDPDIVLFSRIDDIVAVLDRANIALTPHQTEPENTLPAIEDNEICSLRHGIYNLGFVAVRNTPESLRFAEWWAHRVYHYCVADIPRGLFTDQRWIDFATVFFNGVHILKSPRFNVATWNLTTRNLAISEKGTYTVNGENLGFYHFTGFDSGAHRVMATKNAPENEAVKSLVDWYTEQTKFDVLDPISHQTWGFANYSDGTPILLAHRRYYRVREDLQAAFFDPFEADDEQEFSIKSWMINQGPLECPDLFVFASDSVPEVLEDMGSLVSADDDSSETENTEAPVEAKVLPVPELPVEVRLQPADEAPVIETEIDCEKLPENKRQPLVPKHGIHRMLSGIAQFYLFEDYRNEITGNLRAVRQEKGLFGLLAYIFKF